jgi:hypothetical protein
MADLSQYQTKAGFLHNGEGLFLKDEAAIVRDNGEQGLQATVTLTSAQILALHSTPIELVAAPGAGKTILPTKVEAFYDYGTAAYGAVASGDDLFLKYTNGSGTTVITVETTGFIDQTSNQSRFVLNSGALTPTADAALVASLGGAVTTGDGTVTLRIEYDVVTLLS